MIAVYLFTVVFQIHGTLVIRLHFVSFYVNVRNHQIAPIR